MLRRSMLIWLSKQQLTVFLRMIKVSKTAKILFRSKLLQNLVDGKSLLT